MEDISGRSVVTGSKVVDKAVADADLSRRTVLAQPMSKKSVEELIKAAEYFKLSEKLHRDGVDPRNPKAADKEKVIAILLKNGREALESLQSTNRATEAARRSRSGARSRSRSRSRSGSGSRSRGRSGGGSRSGASGA